MFTGSLTNRQIAKLNDLAFAYKDMNADFLKNQDLLDSLYLAWFQAMCIEHAYISKGSIISLDTGLGKTATSAGLVEKLLQEFPESKHIFFCIPASIEQVQDDFKEYLCRNVYKVTGQSKDILWLSTRPLYEWDVLIVSYEALYSIDFCNYLLDILPHIKSVTFDEAHEIAQESQLSNTCTQISRSVEYRLALTATPITSSPMQALYLLNIIDKDFIPHPRDVLKPYEILDPETFCVIDYKPLTDLSSKIYYRYISWTRQELGLCGKYTPIVIMVEPTEEQAYCKLSEVDTVIKGDPDSKQVEAYIAYTKYQKSRGLVGLTYANIKANQHMLLDKLRAEGIKATIVNGEQQNKKYRNIIVDLFKSREIDVIITNITMSINMPCDYVLFWENTNKAYQMIGRCVRGFIPKDLEIAFILTEDSAELIQFNQNVYRKVKWLGEALSKNVDVFNEVNEKLLAYTKSRGVNYGKTETDEVQ